jgi:hypothetical protein
MKITLVVKWKKGRAAADTMRGEADRMTDQTKVGLFPVGYRIGNDMPGAPLFTVHLVVDTPREQVHGAGIITNTANPPLDVHTTLDGDFTYMTVMPNTTQILLVLNGVGPLGTTTPLIGPNVRLRAVMSDWKTGTATYSYTTDGTNWNWIKDVPMELLS